MLTIMGKNSKFYGFVMLQLFLEFVGITWISLPILVEHHTGVQPYLAHRVSQSSHQPFYSAEVVGAPCILSWRGVLPLKKRFSHKFILLKI